MRPAPSGGFVVVEARRDGGLAFDGVRYRLEAVRFRKNGACPLEAVLSFASADAADAAQRRAELELAVPFAVGGDRCADARRAARAVAELMVGLRERPAADLGALLRPGSIAQTAPMNTRREYPPIFTPVNSHEYGVNTA